MSNEDEGDKKPPLKDKKGIPAAGNVKIKTLIYRDLLKGIEAFARQRGISRSDAIAIAIDEYIKSFKQ
ncbi:ribbon-helix-helix protein, CopG family [Methylobacterium sp. ap11]|uniref:ribbon-helix-helix protein, CopG family n=1 Tax=Methylobacterium sp. ap11 TaxID=1761799 RepID=UPI0015A5CA30|nr:ribbon-helix-helix protein, CopG family [Methylobacterium sp. ap11]